MKKVGFLVCAVLMILGFGSFASAAPVLTFDIDFGQDGTFETGGVYDLLPGGSVAADLYFTVTEEGVVGGGFALQYDPSLLAVTGYSFVFPPFLDTGLSYNDPGDLGLEAFRNPAGSATAPDVATKFASVDFECLGPGLTALTLFDFNLVTVQFVTSPSGLKLDSQIPAEGILLASINQVPIPGAVWLLGSGLVGLIAFTRRKRA